MAKYLLPLLCLVAACSPTMTSMNQCVDDVDCGESLICSDGTCIAQPSTACRSDETLPCGPAAVGVCHPGVFRCIDGVFETTCFGEVTGTAETCNGIDDDCDGTVDEGVITAFYVDRDGDGFGSSATGAESRQACTKPSGFADNASDCDDTNPSRKPTAQEICDPSDVDENCDGVANESCACSNPGMMQGCCSGRGFQTCDGHADGGATLSMCSVQPAPEFCNGIDDDCDGLADELFIVVTDDGGIPTLDAGSILPDGGCTIGVGACARTAGVACVMGSLSCLAVEGTPSAETCNNIDDDCDGETDEVSAGLCPAAGQTCSGGACACPSGQTVCGASCETLGGSCTNGVGACTRTGAIACVSGGAACDAVPGPTAPETCDGIDNDCDGQTDEGVQIQCYPDVDEDRYPRSMTPTMLCPDTSRPAFGNCPSGYVAPASALGGAIDCDDGNQAVFVSAAVRRDGDSDGYCVGAAQTQCIGTNPPSGWRFPASCQATDDCNDSNAAVYRTENTYADADNDGRCAGQESTECIGANPPAGRRLSATCVSVNDCNDANANFWILGQTRADADNDGYCSGSATNTCNGTSAPAGRRFVNACNVAPDDCNDTNSTQFTSRQVRADADNDTYCVGNVFTQCAGATVLPGTRLTGDCNQTIADCSDTNPNATSSCSLTVSSQSRIKACGFNIPATQPLSFDWMCPTGFQAISSTFSRTNPEARITDPAFAMPSVIGSSGTTGVNFTCRTGAVGQDTWRLDVACNAL